MLVDYCNVPHHVAIRPKRQSTLISVSDLDGKGKLKAHSLILKYH